MTKTTKCTRRLVQKFVCIWALVLSTHQVASMDLRSKSEARSHNRVLEANPTKMDNAKSSNHGAKSSKSAKSKSSGSGRGAIFAMTNASGGNEIIMYARKKNGRLRYTGSPFSTGGVGGDLVLQSPPDDPLASQNSLVVADNCLLAVNAGSNTLTSFEIRAEQGNNRGLHQVSIVGSGGEIPVSIAYSSANRFVYALNSGGPGSISGFTLNDECFLEPIPNSIVSLEQEPSDLLPFPDGPPYFISSPAQIDFTPNSQQLLVTIKGIDGNPLSGGTINQFEVGDTGLVSNKRITETGNDSIAPFSFDFDDDENLLVVNAFGSSTPGSANTGSVSMYNFQGLNNTVSLVQNEMIGQTAVCWIKYSNGCAFTTNNGSSSISSLSVSNSSITLIDSVAASLNNPIDEIFSPNGRYLYALSTGHRSDGQPRIYVYDVINDCGLREIQVISDGLPTEFVTDFGAVGLAVF
mmetsp:Transcript_8712/g.10159  ORF Transcript_8712/g.10159 Transcript_8712/m.10159 type:complete len:464 (+) Transcript_8712:102-1493(+)